MYIRQFLARSTLLRSAAETCYFLILYSCCIKSRLPLPSPLGCLAFPACMHARLSVLGLGFHPSSWLSVSLAIFCRPKPSYLLTLPFVWPCVLFWSSTDSSVRFCVDDDGQRRRWRQQHQAQQEAGAGDAAESEQPQLLLSVQHLHGGRHGVDAGKNIGKYKFFDVIIFLLGDY